MTAGDPAPRLPVRPRLAEHARVRRHVVDGKELVVVHHAITGDLVRMGPREWDLIAGADGTRDLDALALAAARRGALRRLSEIAAVLAVLQGSGLLADGIEPPPVPDASDPSRPLDVLPRFSLVCDGSGGCCGMYGSVVFSPLEAARARALRPEVLGCGEREDRAFTPVHGSSGSGDLAAALVDGRCAFLGGDGRCTLHALGGPAAKPRACAVYPACFVDDGEVVRVSVGVECTCVLESALRPLNLGGFPLVDPASLTRGDLGPRAAVAVLPDEIPLGRASARRADFVAWSRFVALRLPDEVAPGAANFASIFWSLAAAVEEQGLDEEASARAISSPCVPEAAAFAPWIHALAARAEARVDSAGAWRSPRDLSRVASAWIAAAAGALRDGRALAAALVSSSGFSRDEAFCARAVIHGHGLVNGLPLVSALRDRAVRFVLARALPGSIPAGEPWRVHPLALVEAVMRGHGLGAYAAEVKAEVKADPG